MSRVFALAWMTLLMLIVIWLYRSFVPPPPKICGTPGGPPITGPRILLRDGRHLSYQNYGIPMEFAKHNIIFIHGHHENKKDSFLTTKGPFEELQICIIGFDKPGYGESDPHPEQTIKSTTLDIEELGDQLRLGDKFYVVGISSGAAITWGCLKYIPHRLEGVIIASPAINYWWPSLPPDLVETEFQHEGRWRGWSLSIAHYSPWLFHWWNTQQIFTQTKSIYNNAAHYLDIISESDEDDDLQKYSTQQGIHESFHRDEMVVFGKWEFDPLDLEKPFDMPVHIWVGDMDECVSIKLLRYIVQRLPWIHYHQVPNGTHTFSLDNGYKYQMLKALLTNQTGMAV